MSPLLPNDPSHIAEGDARPRDGRAHRAIDGDDRDHITQVPVGLPNVHRVIETMSRAPSLAVALDALAGGLCESLAADASGVMLIDEIEDARMLATRASRGDGLAGGTARVVLGHGLLGHITEARETFVASDVHELGDLAETLHLEQIASFIGVPIVDEGRVLGVLYAASRAPHHFGDQERHLAELMAAGAGSTIARARLADALQLYRHQLETQTSELEATASELELTVQALRRANAELAATADSARAAQVAAESANRAKSAFLATMSHELRTPLNAILGYASLLLDGLAGPLAPAQRDFVERTRVSGRHLLGLVEEVLDIAKVEAGQMRVDFGPVNTARVVNAAVTLVRPQAASSGVAVDANLDVLGEVTGDERRVRQILLNLLANAVKFSRPGGQISVRAERFEGHAPFSPGQLGSWMCIGVTDTGIGIEPEHLETIFEPFVQLDASHTRARGGTGLGLAISRRFARLMGGDITVASRMGQGATFSLWLPAWERDRPATARSAPSLGTERSIPRLPLTGARLAGTRSARVALGELLVATAADIVATVVDRLRGDPQILRARQVSRTELEDHIATYLSDIGQTFAILDERAAAERVPFIADGTAIQQLISERHGAQRHRLGWTEDELRRENEMLMAEVERVVLDSSLLTGSPPNDTLPLLRVILQQAVDLSLRGFAEAQRRTTPPSIPAIPPHDT